MKVISRNRIFLSRDKNVDVTVVSSCRTTIFEFSTCDKFLLFDVASLIYCIFETTADTDDISSKHAFIKIFYCQFSISMCVLYMG